MGLFGPVSGYIGAGIFAKIETIELAESKLTKQLNVTKKYLNNFVFKFLLNTSRHLVDYKNN